MKIDGNIPASAGLATLGDMASNLSVGEVFRAKVISITTNELVLKLMDGSMTKASTLNPLKVNVGDFLEFQVQNIEDNKITLETFKGKTNEPPSLSEQDKAINKALASIGANNSKDPLTIEIVKTLLDNNIKVTPENVNNLYGSVKEFKALDLTPQKAVFLNQNNIPIDAENIQTLNTFSNKDVNIVRSFNEITSSLSSLSNEQLSAVANKVTILESIENLANVISKASTLAASSQEQIDVDAAVQNNIKGLVKDPNFFSALQKVDINNIKELLLKGIPLESLKKASPSALENINSLDSLKNLDTLEILDSLKSQKPLPFELATKKNSIIQDGTSQNIIDGSTNEKGIPEKAETIKKIFDACFVKLKDDLSGDDLDVKDIYKKILMRMEILKDAIADKQDVVPKDISTVISNVDKQLNFTNSINSNHTYVQIPINYEGQKNGELYIIKNKKKKNGENGTGTTVFLSLNTINIGRFETLVNIKDKNVKINIRLEKDELIDFVRKNYNMLYKLLEKTDFKIVDIKCKKIDEEINPVNIEKAIKEEFFSNNNSFNVTI